MLPSDLKLDELVVVQLPAMVEVPKRDSLPIRLYSPPSDSEYESDSDYESDSAQDELLEAKLSASQVQGSPEAQGENQNDIRNKN